MRNTITLNGIASTTIAGLLIQELPAISKPLVRTTIEEIDGRDGDIVTELGYSAYDKEITIGLYGSFDINAVIAYFASEGTVVFSNEPDKFYRYKIIDQIDYERLVRYRTATVKLHCQPFKYPTSETPVQLGSGQTVTAEGTNITMQGTALAPFASVTAKGDTEQTTYSGKNLANIYANYSAGYSTTQNGVTFTLQSDGGIHIKGTAESVATFDVLGLGWSGSTIVTALDNTKTYYVSLARPSDEYRVYVRGIKNGSVVSIASNGNHIVENCTGVTLIQVQVGGGISVDGVVYIQLESGSTATAFEPYVGGTASPNPEYPQDVKVVTGEQAVTVTGRNRANVPQEYSFTRDTHAFHLKAGRYYVSCGEIIKGGQNQPAIGITGNNFYLYENTLNHILDLREDKDITVYSNGWNWNNSSVTSTVKNLIFSETRLESLDDYEPYQSQEYEVNLGKNLVGATATFPTTVSGLTVTKEDDGSITLNGTRTAAAHITLATGLDLSAYDGQTLTLSVVATGTGGFSNLGVKQGTSTNLLITDGINGAGTRTATGAVVFSDYDNVLLDIWISATATATEYTNYNLKIQLEQGSTATDYAPYFEPIELCKIGDYQDYIYKSGGKWYKHEVIKKVTLPTSGYSRWTIHSEACMYYKNGELSDALFQTGAITAVVENLPVKPQVANMTEYYNTYAQVNKYGFVLKTDTPGIMIQNKNYSTVADFHTWIAANPVVVRYVLATPVDTQITNEAVIEQLNALGNANSYRDATYITTTSDGADLPVILAVTATGKADGTVTNAGNTYAKPKLTIYGTGNIGIYLNGSQMFQIELGSEGHITIDTEKMEAYKDTESNLKNRLVTGDYSKFRLEAGANQINFSGNINKCVVENYTRWL